MNMIDITKNAINWNLNSILNAAINNPEIEATLNHNDIVFFEKHSNNRVNIKIPSHKNICVW